MRYRKKILSILKEHWFYIVIILIANIFAYSFFLKINNLAANDGLTYMFHRIELIRQSIVDYRHFWPLWNPYILSGTPFYARPATPMIDSLLGLIMLIAPNAAAALNLTMFAGIQLSGLFMYIFTFYIFRHRKAALISSLIFVLNGSIANHLGGGSLVMINAYFLIPLIMLFTIMSIKKREWVRYAIITGVLFGLQIRTGDIRGYSFTTLIFSLYILFYVIGTNFLKKSLKVILIIAIVVLITFVVAAQKIFPTKELIDLSSRSDPNWEFASGGGGGLSIEKIKDLFYATTTTVGIVALLLSCYGIYKKRKNKVVLYLLTLAIISLMIAANTFVHYFLWKYVPLWRGYRHLHHRIFIIIAFAFSMLAGFGIKELLSTLKSKNFKKITMNIIFGCIVLSIFLNLVVFKPNAQDESEDIYKAINDNSIMQYISKMPEIFRIATYETRGIDWGTEFTQIPLGIQHIYGYESQWYPPYLNLHLSVANQQPAKFWGILNTKYMTSLQKVNISGFRLIGEFSNKMEHYPYITDIQKAWGKYLYENELFLPRVYFVTNSILVVGNEDAKIQIIYSLMLDNRFDPNNTVIIRGKQSINDYTVDDLKKYKAIFLTQGSIDERSGFILKNYVDNGGILLPNVVKGETSIDDNTLKEMWDSFEGELNAVDDENYITHNFDKYEVKLNKEYQKGFIVLSEKFSVFDGWSAKADGVKKDILNAEGMISTVYIDKPVDSIIFKYLPKSVVIGNWISAVSSILIIIYFGFMYLRKKIR